MGEIETVRSFVTDSEDVSSGVRESEVVFFVSVNPNDLEKE